MLEPDAETAPPTPGELWERVADYFLSVPERLRGVCGLLADLDDAESFNKQTMALDAYLRLVLLHGREPNAGDPT